MDKIVNTTYVPLQPPYKVIKHKNKIGVQIGTQMVTISGGSPFKIETHNYPVVAAEDRITPSHDKNHSFDASSEGEVWDNVETKQVSVLCDAGTPLSWVEFIKILWHDHARLRRRSEKINKVYIFEHLIKYNKCQELPSPGQYTIHLHTESSDGEPEVVRSAEDDVFALNVEWTDDTAVLEKKVVSDLLEYLLIISKNRLARFWRMSYETTEERLIPLVERLNANPQATSFKKTLMSSIVVTALLPYEETDDEEAPGDKTKGVEMAESVIDKISANNIRYYYEGWRNGKHGSICQSNGIYRFVEMTRGKSGILDDVKRKEDDNPIVAKGIVSYWLQFNSRMDTVIKRLTKYNCEIPKDIREQFANYTQIRFEQFRQEHRDDPKTWDWDWEYEFYVNTIIPHEIAFNKESEALFDYISDSDIELVRGVMNSYIKYLKKIRTEKGYQVNPELLVLRAIDSGDETKYEDLEEFEINTILDKLEGKGYIQVAWIEGHKPEAVRLLDKGRCYLKQLEEEKVVGKTMPIISPQKLPKENTAVIPPQTPRMPQISNISEEENNEENEWDETYDAVFKDELNPRQIFYKLENMTYPRVTDNYPRIFVFFKVLLYLGWIENHQKNFLKWANCHWKLNWKHDYNFKFGNNIQKELRDTDIADWDDNTCNGSDIGNAYRSLAKKVLDELAEKVNGGKIVDRITFYKEGVKSRINDGKKLAYPF